MKGMRVCPICPACGSKKFEKLKDKGYVKVRCLSCNRVISI